MFYREHEPVRFHAEYLDGQMMVGNIRSRTARRLIRQWAALHRRELEVNWKNMKAGRQLERVEPLE